MKPRTSYELNLMRESGKITAQAIKKVLERVDVGISGLQLNQIAEEIIRDLGGEDSFKTVGGYKFASCITINEQVVHGIPTDRKLKDGDIVSIDLGAVYKGWHTDAAWSVLVRGQTGDSEQQGKERFLKAGREALKYGIKQAVDGKRVGDISAAIQGSIEEAGYHVVRSLVGHGVGKSLHEEPEVPGYGNKGTGLRIEAGMTLAIEAIYTAGTSEVVLDKDGWTYNSADGSMAGLFEMSVIVGKKEAEVLTDWRRV